MMCQFWVSSKDVELTVQAMFIASLVELSATYMQILKSRSSESKYGLFWKLWVGVEIACQLEICWIKARRMSNFSIATVVWGVLEELTSTTIPYKYSSLSRCHAWWHSPWELYTIGILEWSRTTRDINLLECMVSWLCIHRFIRTGILAHIVPDRQ